MLWHFYLFLVIMEERKELMQYYESLCNTANYVGVIDGKIVHIPCPKRVVMNFINVRRARV
jgi:hypothetical protein